MSFWPNNPFPQMDPQGVVSMDLEVAVAVQREVTRRMAESARADFAAYVDKVRERTLLSTMKRDLLAQEAAKAKFTDDFLVFLAATESGDVETLRRFDEREMKNNIFTMMGSDAGDEGVLEGFYGVEVSKLVLGPLGVEKEVAMDSIVASSGGEEGGDDFPKAKLGVQEKAAVVDAFEKPNGDGGEKGGSCYGKKSDDGLY